MVRDIRHAAGRRPGLRDSDTKARRPSSSSTRRSSKKFLNGANPLGQTVQIGAGSRIAQPPREIVGVVADAVYRSLREPIPPTMYVPLAQFDDSRSPAPPSMSISVRSSTGSPALLARSVAAAIAAVNPDLALTFRPLADQVNASLTQERVVAMLSGFFGALALLLAGLGLYGVTSYAVSRRRTEIGIRMALGAAPGGVVRLVLSRVSMLVGHRRDRRRRRQPVGVAVRHDAALRPRTARSGDARPAAAVVLAAVGALAGWLPAHRASRIDPAEVLRDS